MFEVQKVAQLPSSYWRKFFFVVHNVKGNGCPVSVWIDLKRCELVILAYIANGGVKMGGDPESQ